MSPWLTRMVHRGDTQDRPRINQSKIDTNVKQKSESKLEQTMEKTEKRGRVRKSQTHLKLLFSKFYDIFAIVGEEIIILNTANTEAEDAFKCYVDQAEAGAADGDKEEEEA